MINRGLAAIVSILAAAGLWLLPAAAAEEGVGADRILFGQSAALTGPAAELGLEMQRGILAAFGEANAAGGIAGRRIELITLDDRYEPEAAIANTEALIGEHEVFGLIGAVGRPPRRRPSRSRRRPGCPSSRRSPEPSS
jgi:ABC-type branched-subunit amino acid transport system substrate-binding protein